MPDENTIMREALLAIRLELDARKLPLKVCASKAGVSYSTFLSWFPAAGTPQVPSLAALPGLARALPGDLLSLLVPDGFHIVPGPEGVDYDAIAAWSETFTAEKLAAHRADSEMAERIGPNEHAKLGNIVAMFPAQVA